MCQQPPRPAALHYLAFTHLFISCLAIDPRNGNPRCGSATFYDFYANYSRVLKPRCYIYTTLNIFVYLFLSSNVFICTCIFLYAGISWHFSSPSKLISRCHNTSKSNYFSSLNEQYFTLVLILPPWKHSWRHTNLDSLYKLKDVDTQ